MSLGLILGLAQLGMSAYQMSQAQKLSKEKRPDYQIPEGLTEATDLSKYLSSLQEAPGSFAARRRLDDAATEQSYRALEYSDNPAQAIFSAGLAQEKKMDALTELRGIDAQTQQRNTEAYLRQLGLLGEEQKAKQKWDQLDPYLSAKAAESAMRGASMQNFYGALGTLGTAKLPEMGGSKTIDTPTAVAPDYSPSQTAGYGIPGPLNESEGFPFAYKRDNSPVRR